mgnify:CR=1 FL=1
MQRQHHSRVTLTHPQVSHHQGSHELYLNHCLLNLLLSGDGIMQKKLSCIGFRSGLNLSTMDQYVVSFELSRSVLGYYHIHTHSRES